ncbi:heparinase II/III family protein [Pelagibacteraceae bacterium]|jgi:uncharacterized heparinase superfamily protein|nr:heparinase II/III family protein [Pelagibacteraceae bacterium]
MYRLKSIKLYFFSIFKLFFSNFKNFYFKSNFYNKKLISFTPERIQYSPSSYLSASLITLNNDFYKITNTTPELLWKINKSEKLKFDNLHSFLWLARLDRKNSKKVTQHIIKSWIDIFFNYQPNVWEMEITARRIIAWSSNTDLTLEDSDNLYKKKFFLSLVKQSNFLIKNLNSLFYGSSKIICSAAIILAGLIFKENDSSYKIGIKELEKNIKNYFNEEGFPKSRNPEEVFICIKYLVLIREWFKEAQKPIPDFLNEIIQKCGNCYAILSCSNNQFPLFNGATEINYKEYDVFLKSLKYKFFDKNYEVGDLIKVKKKKFEFFIDCGNPPSNNYAKYYQAGCLSFEIISNKKKIICNSGYGKYLSSGFSSLSRSTAAHSTLYINNTSSCRFEKNKTINKMYGNSLIEKLKITKKNYTEDKDYYLVSASHNGYEKKFGYIHTRSIKILKKEDKIFGEDQLEKTRNNSNPLLYFIRFHIYPDTKIVKTKAGNSILISLSNREGWLLRSDTNNFEIDKNIFLGNKSKIINNESIYIAGKINQGKNLIKWSIEKVN